MPNDKALPLLGMVLVTHGRLADAYGRDGPLGTDDMLHRTHEFRCQLAMRHQHQSDHLLTVTIAPVPSSGFPSCAPDCS